MENKEKILNQISVCKANINKMQEELNELEIAVLASTGEGYISYPNFINSKVKNRIGIVRSDLLELKKRIYPTYEYWVVKE